MIVNILLTDEVKATMPETLKIPHNFGRISVRFPAVNPKDEPLILHGDNAVVEGDTQEFIKWLKPFDGVAISECGVPQLEQFVIMHIDENL